MLGQQAARKVSPIHAILNRFFGSGAFTTVLVTLPLRRRGRRGYRPTSEATDEATSGRQPARACSGGGRDERADGAQVRPLGADALGGASRAYLANPTGPV